MHNLTRPTAIESDVREFAARFPTPNVLRMLALCEDGRITWAQAYDLATRALSNGIAAVA